MCVANNQQILDIVEPIAARNIQSAFVESMAIDQAVMDLSRRENLGWGFNDRRLICIAVQNNLKYFKK